MDFCNSCILTFILTIMCFCNPVSKAFNFLLCLEATLAKIWRSSSVESTSSWHLVKNGLMIGFSQHAQSESLALCKNLMIYLMCFLCCIFYYFEIVAFHGCFKSCHLKTCWFLYIINLGYFFKNMEHIWVFSTVFKYIYYIVKLVIWSTYIWNYIKSLSITPSNCIIKYNKGLMLGLNVIIYND